MSARAEEAGGRLSRLTPRGAILAVIVAALLVYLVVPVRAYLGQRAELGRLERQTVRLEQENKDLQAQIGRLDDPAYIERIARECLGMSRPGELSFSVVPLPGTTLPSDC
jgi:cell division protein FtsL